MNGTETKPSISTSFPCFLEPIVVDVFQSRHDHCFDDFSIGCIRDDNVSKSHQFMLTKFDIIELKGSMVVVLVRASNIVVKRTTGCGYNVEHLGFDCLDKERSCSCCTQACREGEPIANFTRIPFNSIRFCSHLQQNVSCFGKFRSSKSACLGHLVNK